MEMGMGTGVVWCLLFLMATPSSGWVPSILQAGGVDLWRGRGGAGGVGGGGRGGGRPLASSSCGSRVERGRTRSVLALRGGAGEAAKGGEKKKGKGPRGLTKEERLLSHLQPRSRPPPLSLSLSQVDTCWTVNHQKLPAMY